MTEVSVYRGRTVVLPVSLSYSVAGDTLTSQIRVARNPTAELIATWAVSFKTDGTDGEIILTLDDTVTAQITHTIGYMDIKRITDGEPVPVFDEPIQVTFKDSVTA